MLKVVAKNYADPKHLDEILKLSRELVELTRGEPGCVSYGVYQDTEHPELLTMIEEWESREALETHLNSAHRAADGQADDAGRGYERVPADYLRQKRETQ